MDKIIRGTACKGTVRFFASVTSDLVEKARKIHNCTPTASAALGRMLTVASMMGVMLKGNNDKVTVQINGKGEAGTIVAVSNSQGIVKGYISNPFVDRPLNTKGKLDVGGAVGTNGNFIVIQDLGLKEPYIGQVPIVSGEIAEDATYYFAASEQVPSAISLGVLVDKNNEVISAGGFILQMMPEADDFIRDILGYRLNEIPSITASINESKDIMEIINELFDGLEPKIFDEYKPDFICECSKERVEKVLLSIGRDELQSMADDQGFAEISCNFCNKKYMYNREELNELIKKS